MLAIIVFMICTTFLIFISQNNFFYQNFQDLYLKDQLKGIACFIRNHEDIHNINFESDVGISNTFFKNVLKVNSLPKNKYAPFDCPILIYKNFFEYKNPIKIFTDFDFDMYVYNTKINGYMIQYYSKYLFKDVNIQKPLVIHIMPNPFSKIKGYLI